VKSFVGNDLVDLGAAHNRGRARQVRFLERVLTRAERERMARENGGDDAFALLWSAKEAAYKAVKKHDPALAFAPRRWQVEVDSLTLSPAGNQGRVTIAPGTQVNVCWQRDDGWVHCIALLGAPPVLLDRAVASAAELDADGDFHERERQGFSCRESAAVRNLARRLLQRCGAGKVDILRTRQGGIRLPPRACTGEVPMAGVDLSLSHDGRFVAAVIATDRHCC